MSDHITGIVMDFGDRDGMLTAINAHIDARIAQAQQEAYEHAARVCETRIDPTRPNTTSAYALWHAKAIRALATEPASRAMLPVTDSQLTDEQEERIRQLAVLTGVSNGRAIIDGRLMVSHGEGDKEIMAFARAVLASPVAGWVSVEERLPEIPADAKYSACVNVLAAFKSDRVRPMRYAKNLYAKTEKGRAPRWEEWDGRLACGNPTHWQELPPAPVTPKQEQSNG